MRIRLKEGSVVDGTGLPAFAADVWIEADRMIAAMGRPKQVTG
jgi:N-acyl-D-aspartate/D-glutamate deacylase